MHELNAHADAGSLQWNVACAFRDAVNAKLLLHFGRFGVAGVTPMSHPPARPVFRWLRNAWRRRGGEADGNGGNGGGRRLTNLLATSATRVVGWTSVLVFLSFNCGFVFICISWTGSRVRTSLPSPSGGCTQGRERVAPGEVRIACCLNGNGG